MRKNNLKFCIPTDFSDRLVENVSLLNSKSKNSVIEFFGSHKESPFGSGRPSKILQSISFDDLKCHIGKCHEYGIFFNYLLNGACVGAKEFDSGYLKVLINFVEKLELAHVDMVTIANPYLVSVIRNKFPKLKICLSIIAGVNSMQEIKIYENLRVDRIVLDANINRDFTTLKNIRAKTNVKLELLANNPCLLKCPFRRYHPEIDSHISIKEQEIPIFPSVICKYIRLEKLEEIIKSPWIRPSDIHHYSEIGVEYIKLGGRGKDRAWILKMVKHYLEEYDGSNFYQFIEKNGWDHFRKKNKELQKLEVSIPKLPEYFLDFFRDKKFECGNNCEECKYCNIIAKKYVRVNSSKIRDSYIKEIKKDVANVTNPKTI